MICSTPSCQGTGGCQCRPVGVAYGGAYVAGLHQKIEALTAENAKLREPALVDQVMTVKTSIDTMREAARALLAKNGWKPGSLISGHSAVELMAAFGMQVYRGEVGCDYPDCGCCADAACGDAVKQHPDLGGTPIAAGAEGIGDA